MNVCSKEVITRYAEDVDTKKDAKLWWLKLCSEDRID